MPQSATAKSCFSPVVEWFFGVLQMVRDAHPTMGLADARIR